MNRLVYNADGRWSFLCPRNNSHLPSGAGFNELAPTIWQTEDIYKAYKLRKHADAQTQELIQELIVRRDRKLYESYALEPDHGVTYPVPDKLAYYKFQEAGIQYMDRHDGTLLADPMGVGKTIQMIGFINFKRPKRTLYICPANLKINSMREMLKWLVGEYNINLIGDTRKRKPQENPSLPTIDIVNYDILHKHEAELLKNRYEIVFADEAHKVKNPNARRSKAFYNICTKIPRKVFSTGTPLLNKPSDLFHLLNLLAPRSFPDYFKFMHRFCKPIKKKAGKYWRVDKKTGAKELVDKEVWDWDNEPDLEYLQRAMREVCMIRRSKQDVLHELPPKVRELIVLEGSSKDEDSSAAIKAVLDKLFKAMEASKTDDYKTALLSLTPGERAGFAKMSASRKSEALKKAPQVVDFVIERLAETDQKVIVFAHHKEVIDALMAGFQGAGFETVKLDGGMGKNQKQASVDQFQTGTARVFIGSIQAAGVGYTLTAASYVVFAELDWTSAMVSQAEDRAWRDGQVESVLVQHLVRDGSIDYYIAQKMIEKQIMSDTALNKEAIKRHVAHKLTLSNPEHPLSNQLNPIDVQYIQDIIAVVAASQIEEQDALVLGGLADLIQLTKPQAALGCFYAKKYRSAWESSLKVPADLVARIGSV